MRYNVPNLSEKTPKSDQEKLVKALKGVEGVRDAQLHLNTHQIEIMAKDKDKGPKRDAVSAASSKAGFAFEAKKH